MRQLHARQDQLNAKDKTRKVERNALQVGPADQARDTVLVAFGIVPRADEVGGMWPKCYPYEEGDDYDMASSALGAGRSFIEAG